MALRPLRSKASSSSWRWAGVKRSRPSLPARMMEESEGAGWDGVDCIRGYVCSRCPRLASGRQLSAYHKMAVWYSATMTIRPSTSTSFTPSTLTSFARRMRGSRFLGSASPSCRQPERMPPLAAVSSKEGRTGAMACASVKQRSDILSDTLSWPSRSASGWRRASRFWGFVWAINCCLSRARKAPA